MEPPNTDNELTVSIFLLSFLLSFLSSFLSIFLLSFFGDVLNRFQSDQSRRQTAAARLRVHAVELAPVENGDNSVAGSAETAPTGLRRRGFGRGILRPIYKNCCETAGFS
jgi:hypothetical protein